MGKNILLPQDYPFMRNVTASIVGSVATILTLNPLFVLKVRVQNMDVSPVSVGNIVNEAVAIRQKRGFLGFWAGATTSLIMSIPNTVVYMTSYEKCREFLRQQYSHTEPPSYLPAIAGAIARMISVSVVSPFELIRTMQSGGEARTFRAISSDIIRRNGFMGLYKGWVPTIWRDCPFSALYWFSFESSRPHIQRIIENKNSSFQGSLKFSPWVNFLSGATAGTLAAVVTQPFDVIKTKQQLNPPGNKISTVSILKNADIRTLTSGLSLRLMTVIPACGIVITVYEAIKNY
jgi:solute carrier family 25 protein 39/40